MNEYVYGLDDYIRVARERWKTIAAVTLLVLLAALVVTAARPVTDAVADQGGIDTEQEARDADPDNGTDASDLDTEDHARDAVTLRVFPLPTAFGGSLNINAEQLILLSDGVLHDAADDLSINVDEVLGAVEISPLPEAESLVIAAHEVDGTSGERIGRVLASAYLDQRAELIELRYTGARNKLRAQIEALRSGSGGNAGSLPTVLRISALEVQLAGLNSEAASAQPGEILSSSRYSDLIATPSPSPSPEVVEETALEPEIVSAPVGRPWARNGIAGLVLGLILGYGVALFRDAMSPRFRSTREAKERLGLPMLASIDNATADGTIGDLGTQTENLLRREGQRSLAWLDVTNSSQKAFIAFAEQMKVGGAGIEVIDTTAADVASRAQAEAALRRPAGENSLLLVHAGVGGPTGTALAWASACDAALIALDLRKARRDETEQQIGNLKRAGTEPLGVVLIL